MEARSRLITAVLAALLLLGAVFVLSPIPARATITNPALIMSYTATACAFGGCTFTLWRSVPAKSAIIVIDIEASVVSVTSPTATFTSDSDTAGNSFFYTVTTQTVTSMTIVNTASNDIFFMAAYSGVSSVKTVGAGLQLTGATGFGVSASREVTTGNTVLGMLGFTSYGACLTNTAYSGFLDIINGTAGGSAGCGAAVSAPITALGTVYATVSTSNGLVKAAALEAVPVNYGGKIAFDSSCFTTQEGPLTSVKFSCAVPLGDTVVLSLATNNGVGSVRNATAVTDSGGNPYRLVKQTVRAQGANIVTMNLWASVNVAHTASWINIVMSGSTTKLSIYASLYANVRSLGGNTSSTGGLNPAHQYLALSDTGGGTWFAGSYAAFANCASPPTLAVITNVINGHLFNQGVKYAQEGACAGNTTLLWTVGVTNGPGFNQTTNTTQGLAWANAGVVLSSVPPVGGNATWINPPQNTTAGVIVQSTSWLGPLVAVMLMGLLAYSIFEAYRKKFA